MGELLMPGLARDVQQAAANVHRRRRRRLQLAGAGVLTAVGLLAVTVNAVVQAPPASADVEITVRDGEVVVRLTDVQTRADVVEEALGDAGIDADVTEVPVGPTNVGRFAGFSGDDAEALDERESNGYSSQSFAVPTTYRGHLDITIGRLARPDELYTVASDALAAGEPLACVDLVGRPARDLAALATDHPGIDIRALAYDNQGAVIGTAMPAAELPVGPFAEWLVAKAEATSSRHVIVFVTLDGRSPFLQDRSKPAADDGCD